MLAYNYWV